MKDIKFTDEELELIAICLTVCENLPLAVGKQLPTSFKILCENCFSIQRLREKIKEVII